MYWHALSIGGTEWVIIIFVALVLILGTGKLPGAARKIGRAVNEYNRAKSGIEEHVKDIQGMAGGMPKITGPVESERAKLEVIARSAGIDPDGKSDGELQNAISEKIGRGREAGAGRTGADETGAATTTTTPAPSSPAPHASPAPDRDKT